MEIQVGFLGSNVDLKLVLIWFLFSHVGFRTGCKLFILKVRPVISAQKVLFCALFKIGFECFLRTNHIN